MADVTEISAMWIFNISNLSSFFLRILNTVFFKRFFHEKIEIEALLGQKLEQKLYE